MKKLFLTALLCVSAVIFAQDSPGVYTIKNVKINTNNSDFGTAFFGSNQVVFAAPKEGFTFNREEHNSQPFLDLYIGEVTDDGQLIHKHKMPGDINTKFHEGMVSFSKDGKTVYFSANGKIKKVKKGKKGKDDTVKTKGTISIQLFKATIDENGEWGNLEMLPFNSDDFSTGHPVLNKDDTKLYFVSDRPESLGKTDLFYVDVYPDGTYGQPVNLGPQINTAEREMFPFIGKDNVLYFSSDGYPGYGALDVYASKIFDNTVSEPINLEEPVNSEMDDFAYIIDDTKNKGYFSSNRDGGKGDDDIYSFTASPPIHIECQQEISGVVRNIDTQELIPNVKIMLFDEVGHQLNTFLSNENDASFSFNQSCNTTYKIKGYLEGYLIGELDIKTVNDLDAKPLEIVMHMEVDPTRTLDAIASSEDAAESGNISSSDDAPTSASSTIMESLAAGAADRQTIADTKAIADTQASAGAQNEIDVKQIDATSFKDDGVALSNIENENYGAAQEKGADAKSDALSPGKEQAQSEEPASPSIMESLAGGAVVSQTPDVAVRQEAEELVDESTKDQALADVQSETDSNQIDATSFEQGNVAVSDAQEKGADAKADALSPAMEQAQSEEPASPSIMESLAAGADDQVIADAQNEIDEKQDSEDDRNGASANDANQIDATTFERDRVQVSHVAQAGVQIGDQNGFNINTIYFDFDKYDIRYDARIELDKLVTLLRENPEMKIEVNSHTDIRGTEKYNSKLSDKRANQTVLYLTDSGIDPLRISGKGFGEMKVAEVCTKENPCNGLQHQLNRRSEFLIRQKDSDVIVFRSRNRKPSLNDDNGQYTANSGLFLNYNFYEDDQVYTVQVGAFKGKVQTDKYSELNTLFNHRYNDGLNRYYSGIFENSAEAKNHMRRMHEKGFSDAFVVKIKGEDRF